MIDKVLTKVFGTSNERIIKKLWPVVATINDFEPAIKQLSDDGLRAKTVEFRARIAAAVEQATKGIEGGIENREERDTAQLNA